MAQDSDGLNPFQRDAARLASIVDSSDDAIVSKDLNSTVLSWNAAAERMFGFTAADIVGRSIRLLIPEDRQGEEDDVLARIRRGERVEHYETVRRRKDGTFVPVSLTVSPLRDPAGNIIGASKIARDITERVLLETAAREHTANSEKLAEIGTIVASTLDRSTLVTRVVELGTDLIRADCGIFFYREGESDAHVSHAVSGECGEALARFMVTPELELLKSALRTGETLRIDDTASPSRVEHAPYLHISKHIPARSYLTVPVTGLSGAVIGALCFGHGGTGAFREQEERLAHGVAAWASVALENSRLLGEAREANRVKDEFLAVLSHELRTPLNAIVGYARLLRDGVLSAEKASRGLEVLDRNATWLTQIVEDVLDVSRIVSGKLRLDVQPVDLLLIANNAVATVQPAADAKGVHLEITVDAIADPVSGDPGRLQQVIWNLLSNAVKFTSSGGRVELRVSTSGGHVEILVRDSGAGISPDFLPHVFDRFRQADSGTTRTAGGLGLGLAIVRHIVEMHGGTVEAASPGEGRGSTFRVRFPLTVSQLLPIEGLRERTRAERQTARTDLADLRGVRVLAVDDERDALGLLCEILEAAGAEVTALGAATHAIDRIDAFRPDVLVLDLGMPGVDGFELITRIRQSTNAAVRDVPAAALTAFARSEDRTRALRCGFEMHLAKPIDPGELVASVATLAKRARPAKVGS